MRSLERISVAIACLVFVGGVQAEEKHIKRSELPPAVEKTVKQVSKDATIRGFSQETEKGKTTYEAEMLVNGHSKDVEMDASGEILEVEEQVALESLPAAVKDGLTAKAAGGKILKVESLMKHGKLVAYEAQIRSAGKRHEIQVGPDGQPLDHEE
jgi:hypothetical protein